EPGLRLHPAHVRVGAGRTRGECGATPRCKGDRVASMRLVYDLRYATDHFPGIGTQAWGLGRELVARATDEPVVLLWDPRAQNSRFDVDTLRSQPGARWQAVDVPALSWRTARGTGHWLERLGAD